MTEQEGDPCAMEVGKLKQILEEKKGKLQRDLAFEKKFQETYGLNETRPVEDIEIEIKAVEKLITDVCEGEWCKKRVEVSEPKSQESLSEEPKTK